MPTFLGMRFLYSGIENAPQSDAIARPMTDAEVAAIAAVIHAQDLPELVVRPFRMPRYEDVQRITAEFLEQMLRGAVPGRCGRNR